MEQKTIPLLEFDMDSEVKFTPEHFETTPRNLPERCVMSFSRSSMEAIAEKYNATLLAEPQCCTCSLPVYGLDFEGEQIALTVGLLGAAGAASQIHELAAGGVKKFIACGAAGTLTPKPLGALIIPNAAVRDEGASFHYAPPSYEIEADAEVVKSICNSLQKLGLPHGTGKTWTTDGFYRETEEKSALRRKQGCLTVEMECSAMIAAARYCKAKFGQILYCGDDLSGTEYDSRQFAHATDVRRNLVEYALKCVGDL